MIPEKIHPSENDRMAHVVAKKSQIRTTIACAVTSRDVRRSAITAVLSLAGVAALSLPGHWPLLNLPLVGAAYTLSRRVR